LPRCSLLCGRLWYVTASARKAAAAAADTAAEHQNNSSVPVEIGYMNVIPKCLDSSGKYPVYENLPETYAAINSYLAENPLEGFTLQLSASVSTGVVENLSHRKIIPTRSSTG